MNKRLLLGIGLASTALLTPVSASAQRFHVSYASPGFYISFGNGGYCPPAYPYFIEYPRRYYYYRRPIFAHRERRWHDRGRHLGWYRHGW